jgi:response regulator RpfG family c-di-GMP phosphodiesterase
MTSSPSSQLPDLSGLTVLVVDDDEDAIEVLTTMMTAGGAEVLFARSGSEGLAYLDTMPHLDVVVYGHLDAQDRWLRVHSENPRAFVSGAQVSARHRAHRFP